MPIHAGTKRLAKAYLDTKQIVRAYLDTNLIYQSGPVTVRVPLLDENGQSTNLTCYSYWNGYESGYGEIRYSTPTSTQMSGYLHLEDYVPAGATIVSRELHYDVASSTQAYALRNILVSGTEESDGAFQTVQATAYFRAYGGYGGEGQHRERAVWSNIYYEIKYTL